MGVKTGRDIFQLEGKRLVDIENKKKTHRLCKSKKITEIR